MALDFNSTDNSGPANWLELVSSELRSWWEVINPPPARNPDPFRTLPPPLVSRPPVAYQIPGGGALDQSTMLMIALVVVAVFVLKK